MSAPPRMVRSVPSRARPVKLVAPKNPSGERACRTGQMNDSEIAQFGRIQLRRDFIAFAAYKQRRV